jgi:UDP-3-O-[3-hydroxymyristoyl] glucosamine N-acyltransferase
MKLGEIAERLSCSLEGDEALDITGVATLEMAGPGDLSFFTNIKYYPKAKTTRASALIVGQDCPQLGLPLLRNENAYLAFAKAVELFYRPAP